MKQSEMIYLYDGSLDSLLTLIFFLFQERIEPFDIQEEHYQPNLLEQVLYPNLDVSETIVLQVERQFGKRVFQTVMLLYLSNHPHKECLMYYFLFYSRKYSNKVFQMYPVKILNVCFQVTKQVLHERHRWTGFLRFKELADHTLYATFSPDHNVLYLLAYHFKQRFANEQWIIHDVKRDLLCIYDKKEFYFVRGEEFHFKTIHYSFEESKIEELWKEFYQTIGIESRKNERCRMNFMPKKYWKYIIEVSEENEKSSNK